MTQKQAQRVVAQTTREHWGYLYACLVKQLNNFDLAEDALQEAILSALEHWPTQGTPEFPRAWLLQTARRKAIDRLRRQARYDSKQDMTTLLDTYQENDLSNNPEDIVDQPIQDERLRLIFTCCHPALSESAHIALTLRTLGVSDQTTPSIFPDSHPIPSEHPQIMFSKAGVSIPQPA